MILRICYLIILSIGLFQCQRIENQNAVLISLEGEDWGVFFGNEEQILSPDYNASALETIKVPGNLKNNSRYQKGTVWLRKSFEVSKQQKESSLSLEIGKVFQSDEVYLNGVLVGKNGSSFGQNSETISFGVSRIYPIPNSYINEGENTISIKIESELTTASGILTSPIRIVTFGEAMDDLLHRSLLELIYIGFYLFIALFFLMNYIRMQSHLEYRKFSFFAFLFSLFELSRNEARLLFWNDFTGYKFIEYGLLLFLPYPFLRFIQEFFRVKPLPFQRFYLIFPAVFLIVFLVEPNPVFWYNFIGYWDIHLIFILGYAFTLTIYKLKENTKEAWIHLIALLYLFYAILKEIGIERGFLSSSSILENAFLFYLLSMTIALRFQFLFMKRKIQNRFDRLKEADSLREKIFYYMDAMITVPLLSMKSFLQEIRITPDRKKEKSRLNEIMKIQDSIGQTMDDIIELSRLEVLKEMPFGDRINFIDFINQLISKRKITYAIKVDEDTEIETSLDLVNSIVIRMIDFPLFVEFSHNDLIITQDLKGNVHFRFLLFHPNPKITNKVYEELLNEHKELNPLRVKWAIVLEIVRLLDLKLDIQIIKKKYLKIDLGMKAISNQKTSVLSPLQDPVKGEKLILKKIKHKIEIFISFLFNKVRKLKKRK